MYDCNKKIILNNFFKMKYITQYEKKFKKFFWMKNSQQTLTPKKYKSKTICQISPFFFLFLGECHYMYVY